jgi:hypothetical protein
MLLSLNRLIKLCFEKCTPESSVKKTALLFMKFIHAPHPLCYVWGGVMTGKWVGMLLSGNIRTHRHLAITKNRT